MDSGKLTDLTLGNDKYFVAGYNAEFDISPDGEDHCPLVFGNVPYVDRLHRLGHVGYRGTIILEVNGYCVSDLAAAEGVHPFRLLCDSFKKLTLLSSRL